MSNHVWGLLHDPEREWRHINAEHESVSHLYVHYILKMAAIPVVCSFIGTTQFGWSFGGEESFKVSLLNGLALGVAFYALILLAVVVVGSMIHWLARKIPSRPSRNDCIIFAGYIATPMFLSGVFAIYPIFWLCMLAMIAGIIYTAYLLYKGTPSFLGISHKEGFILSGTTLGAGVLILELMLAVVVLLWSMGSEHSVVWKFFE
ncbi:YIP1 family protein [Vibrio sp.]|uniref:YIP1 family protein n=1 Tax=Vibrio viridaestus TaxID=2487322 RepID=A0A3N9TKY0_9VIBR|nr:Yip1 family protein [Vibrio viridaestus]MDC0612428.1 YIP1 family protein [Vibrio sp.]RQW65009.1 YIP1 family protein [Vibrio viridaestus]